MLKPVDQNTPASPRTAGKRVVEGGCRGGAVAGEEVGVDVVEPLERRSRASATEAHGAGAEAERHSPPIHHRRPARPAHTRRPCRHRSPSSTSLPSLPCSTHPPFSTAPTTASPSTPTPHPERRRHRWRPRTRPRWRPLHPQAQPQIQPRPSSPFLHRSHHRLSLRADPPPRAAATAAVENPSAAASTAPDVEMFRGGDGVWTARTPTVVVLWDLDNKPPRGPPFEAATSLREAASLLGRVDSVSAFANRHAFTHLPAWVTADRRDRRALDRAERAGVAAPPVPYSCAVCGRRFPTRPDLTRHFRQLHERERNKKLGRLRSLKGKKRQKFRERYISGNTKYEDAARELLTPKVGYGLDSELRRAGVHVRTVPDKPQAADQALKRQVKHAIACGVDWVVLVSDDSDFTDTVRNARAAALRMVVVGDGYRALGKVADIWLPWDSVQNGEVDEEMMRSGRVPEFRYEEDYEQDEDEFVVDWDTNELDDVVDDIVTSRTKMFGSTTVSAFAEEDIVDGVLGLRLKEDDMLWSSDDEDDDGNL